MGGEVRTGRAALPPSPVLTSPPTQTPTRDLRKDQLVCPPTPSANPSPLSSKRTAVPSGSLCWASRLSAVHGPLGGYSNNRKPGGHPPGFLRDLIVEAGWFDQNRLRFMRFVLFSCRVFCDSIEPVFVSAKLIIHSHGVAVLSRVSNSAIGDRMAVETDCGPF